MLGQSHRERRPASVLGGHLSCVWIQQVAPDSIPYTHRSVPNGSVELFCQIGSVPQVVGPQTGPRVETLAPGSTVVGVRFRPGAAPSVLGLPASELVDLTVGAQELWGAASVALGEKVANAATPQEAAAALERAVFGRLPDAADPDPLVAEAVEQLLPWRTNDVGSLTSSLYISERQLRRRCHDAIGLAPKALHRLLRFQGFLALVQGHHGTDRELAALAAEAGYADQPHLTRECLRLAGISPRAFLREIDENCGSHDHGPSHAPLLRWRAQRAA
jgi:AraC-like DNA-binding protein